MDFAFSKEHQLFRRMVHEFAEQEVRPLAGQVDREERMPPELIRKLGENGLLGVPFPQRYGGAGLGEIGYCILMEEIGRVCTSTATLIGAHIGIGTMSIYMGGQRGAEERYMPVLYERARRSPHFCLTEPDAGSGCGHHQDTCGPRRATSTSSRARRSTSPMAPSPASSA